MYLKNIDHAKVLSLADEVGYLPGQIASKTMAQNDFVSLTLFAFDAGEEISTHESKGDAMVTVLDGSGDITIDSKTFLLQEGETIVMPANTPHAVKAKTKFKMLLTVVFPLPASGTAPHKE